jgi:DNA-binding transcriptional regulator YdaS (Cro superfamily)
MDHHHPTDTVLTALDEAIDKAHGVTNLADRIGVKQNTVSMWRSRAQENPAWAVPAENCPAIERETGVRCERLNPRTDWAVLRLLAANESRDGADQHLAGTNN